MEGERGLNYIGKEKWVVREVDRQAYSVAFLVD